MDEAIGTQLKELRRLINKLELDFARLAGRFSASYDPHDPYEMQTPVQWLREECRMTSHAASTAVNIGECEPELEESTEALTTGEIGMAHLSWMANTAARIGNSRSATGQFNESTLLPHAKKMSVLQFRRKCEQFIHAADHASFIEEQITGVESRTLNVINYEDGYLHLDGYLDREGVTMFLAAIDPLARTKSDDGRTLAQRRGDALVELCSKLLDDAAVPMRAGQRPHIQVTTTLETLDDWVGGPAAETENGALLSGTTVQRLACDATIIRVLLNSQSQVIDVGRASRVVPPATRRALNVRDKGCVWPGCDRTANWTQAHHMIHWTDWGLTDAENLVLLCRRHHWMVHEGGYAIARTESEGILTFMPLPGMYPMGRDPALAIA